MLVIPLVGLVVTSTLQVRRSTQEVAQVRDETQLARSSNGPAGVITRLQEERRWAVTELVGLAPTYDGPIAGYEANWAATEEALEAFRADVESQGGVVEAAYRDALAELEAIRAIRGDIEANTVPHDIGNLPFSGDVYDRYTELIVRLIDANVGLADEVDDPGLRRGVELANIATHQVELEATISRDVLVTASLSPGGIDTAEEMLAIGRGMVAFRLNNDHLVNAPAPYADIIAEHHPTGLAEALPEMATAALEGQAAGELTAGWVDRLEQARGAGYEALRDALLAEVSSRADDLNAAAAGRQRSLTIVAMAVVVLAAAGTLLVARSIVHPLRRLTRQAQEIAGHRLPEAVLSVLDRPLGEDVLPPRLEPVAVNTRDEVGDVAAALDTVQQSAFELAVEQAVLRYNIADSFVSLGRRNQSLLGRQLDFITELESREADPDVLASLFRLDHLATRMRRNAESLLVLAGVEPPRQWTVPVRATDVVRAALGEVEDYRRVRVDDVQRAKVVGSAAADLAHLLAELLENALAFSPPEEAVMVRGGWQGQGRFRLVVIDRGVGMPAPTLEQANHRLDRTESFTVAPSRYLGHYVAGMLAARHGIRVHLEPGAPQGTVAIVDLPPHLLPSDDAAPGNPPVAGATLAPGNAPVPA